MPFIPTGSCMHVVQNTCIKTEITLIVLAYGENYGGLTFIKVIGEHIFFALYVCSYLSVCMRACVLEYGPRAYRSI